MTDKTHKDYTISKVPHMQRYIVTDPTETPWRTTFGTLKLAKQTIDLAAGAGKWGEVAK
jgi:hypothetical protein